MRSKTCSSTLASTHHMPGAPSLSHDHQKCLQSLPRVPVEKPLLWFCYILPLARMSGGSWG